MLTRTFANPRAAEYASPILPTRQPLEFHRRLSGYQPTPLMDCPTIADLLGVGEVWVKDESSRLGLPSFKILGASWATYRAVTERLGEDPGDWRTTEELADRLTPLQPLTLTAATDGNHGRAVARVARLLGFGARIFVPRGTARARIEAIEGEGAPVTVVDGTYDDAVEAAVDLADERHLLIQDTAMNGNDPGPRWVIEGYSTIFWEIDDRLTEEGRDPPGVVAVQIGVGALAASVVRHYRRAEPAPRPRILGVEPDRAACVLASMEAGEIVSIPGPHDSAMAGLNAGTPSSVAWPEVSSGIDVFVAVEDEWAFEAMRAMAKAGLVSGETGGAGLAGLLAILAGEKAATAKALGIGSHERVLLISTEGATDPDAYRQIVGE